MHWETYLCTGKHICALKNIFVHWKTYLCTRKHICALKNIFVHWETYLCTEKHICALKIYNCALKNMPVMCSDQYLCTEIFICALHIWATVRASSPGTSQQTRDNTDPACVISVDFARGFAFLHWFNLRYGLHCFVFFGCIVVYPVLHKFVLTRKLRWPMVCTYKFTVDKHVRHAIGQGFGIG